MFKMFRSKPKPVVMPLEIAEPHEWNSNDSSTLALFLRSESGKKMQEHLYYIVYQSALLPIEKTAFDNGRDAGRNEMLGRLMALSDTEYFLPEEED